MNNISLYPYEVGDLIENFSNQPTPENTSVTTVLYENDKLSILEFSDVSHLKLGSR